LPGQECLLIEPEKEIACGDAVSLGGARLYDPAA
jgi:hypothetical protein